MELKSRFGYLNGLCLRFNLNVFYLKRLLWFAIGIALEHTRSEAEEVKNGH